MKDTYKNWDSDLYFKYLNTFEIPPNKQIKKLPREFLEKILYGTGDEEIDFEYSSSAGVRKFRQPFEGVLPTLDRRYRETKSQGMREFYEMYMSESPCEACHGARLKKETLAVTVNDKNIKELTDMPINQIKDFIANLKLDKTEAMIANQILKELNQRLQFLIYVGLEYLTLSRPAGTLSGGEAQRVKLASELQKKATGKTVYILDEPTTGLHSHDVARLIEVLNRIVDQGDTVIVIEHNLDVIKVADHIIDLGLEGGDNGGTIVVSGTPEKVSKNEISHTGRFLRKVLE